MKMKANKAGFIRLTLPVVLIIAVTATVYAQDPVLPATNLGLANIFDGKAGKPGVVYQGFVQAFQTHALYDQKGNRTTSDLKVNSVLLMNQFLTVTPVKVLNGNLCFTILVPIVQVNTSNVNGPAPAASPSALGDPIFGAAIQWSDRKLFQKPFSHRLEFDVSTAWGNYDSRYAINPSAHLWTYITYYAFTITLNKQLSVSSRNELNYNSHIIDAKDKPGAFYNGNYSVEYSILPAIKLEAVAYYLQQINQDSYGGDHHYYQDHFGISNTKEKVLGLGPGLAYFTPHGVFFETKVFFETDAKNRFAGTRTSLRVTIPLSK